MALSRIELMRARLKEQEDRRTGNSTRTNQDKTLYPFWNIPENSTTTLRFLPDQDDTNPFIWIERLMINLPFPGIKDEIGSKPCVVKVPCMEMYGEADPIIAEVNPFWGTEFEETARTYWKKRSYLYQGLVVQDGLKEAPEDKPENPIRRFIIGPQIHQLVKTFILDVENKEDPADYINGIDFRINKTTKGRYADFSSSTWSRHSRALSDEDIEAINHYGLFNLRDFLPNKPTIEEQGIIKEMFNASINEEPFDMARWGNHFKPSGYNDEGSTVRSTGASVASTPASAASATVKPKITTVALQPAPVDDEDDSPFATSSPVQKTVSGGNKANHIIDMIRNRP